MTAARVDVAALIAELATTHPDNTPLPLPPLSDHDEHRERAMSCGTWDWAGSEWFMADVKGQRR